MIQIKHRFTCEVLKEVDAADLCGEKLKSAPVFIYGLKWLVTVTNEFLTIGCQRHTHAEWTSFSDETIKDMHFSAIDFWRQWKPVLLSVCAIQSAVKQRSLQEPSPL